MNRGRRSPFGDLVYAYRRRMTLTQRQLARYATEVTSNDPRAATISERALGALERQAEGPGGWVRPRPSTVRTLAQVFGLAPGSPEYEAFVRAADFDEDPAPAPADVAPFIVAGREPHLNRLERAVEAALRGEPGMVVVAAIPGTGKTWLLEEACRRALTRHPVPTVLWAECLDRHGGADPHLPFRQILHLMIGDLDAASPRQLIAPANADRIAGRIPDAARAIIAHGRGLLARHDAPELLQDGRLSRCLDASTRDALLATVTQSAPAEADAPTMHEQLFRILADYAADGPVILVLDDLQWAETETCATLFHLAHRMHGQRLPLLVLGAIRPGALGDDGAGRRHPLVPVIREAAPLYPELMLDLSTAVGGEPGWAFVTAMLAQSSLPQDLATSIFARTDGLPLFVTSFLRLHADVGTADAIGIPAEIGNVFAEQLDRLPAELQNLLRVASVQGMEFGAETLMFLLDLPASRLIELVDTHLVRHHRLLVPGGRRTIGGRAVHSYAFMHALLRDFIYHDMTDLERAHHHAATADALTALYGLTDSDATGAIAFHRDRAGDATRAARAYLLAGDHAMKRGDFGRALARFCRIGELGIARADPFTAAQAFVGIGNSARALGRPEDARRALGRALDLGMRRKLPLVQANALLSLAYVDFDAGRMQRGAERIAEAIEGYLRADDKENAARSLASLSFVLYGMGRYDDAIDAAVRGIGIAVASGHDSVLSNARIALGNAFMDLGRYEDALVSYGMALDVATELGDTQRETVCLLNIALTYIYQGTLEAAEATLARVTAPGRVIVPRLAAAAAYNSGLLAEGRDDWRTAEHHYTASLATREEIGQAALSIDSLAGLLRVAVAQGDRRRTREQLAEIERRLDGRGLDGIEHPGLLFVALIEAALACADRDAARSAVGRATAFLHERARRIASPADRESYLYEVRPHRRIFTLAAQVLGAKG